MLYSTLLCFVINATNSRFMIMQGSQSRQGQMFAKHWSWYTFLRKSVQMAQTILVSETLLLVWWLFFVCLFLDLYLKIPCLPLGSLQQLCEMLGQNPKALKWCSDTSQNVSGFDWWHVHPSCDHEWSGWGTYRLWWNASFGFQFTPKLTTILLSFSLQKLLSSKWKRMPVT